MLKIVTFTGADDSVEIPELEKLSRSYPWVEWGLLLSRNSQGINRFPSKGFLDEIWTVSAGMRLSGHLCGSYVREFLVGRIHFLKEIPTWDMFNRIQINTHGQTHDYSIGPLVEILKHNNDKEFIFQYDNANRELINELMEAGCENIATLFDLSHGAGVLPEEWPDPIKGLHCGYAGGISPSNIELQIRKVEKKVGLEKTWIDMETHVRSEEDRVFNLGKVIRCIDISYPYIHK